MLAGTKYSPRSGICLPHCAKLWYSSIVPCSNTVLLNLSSFDFSCCSHFDNLDWLDILTAPEDNYITRLRQSLFEAVLKMNTTTHSEPTNAGGMAEGYPSTPRHQLSEGRSSAIRQRGSSDEPPSNQPAGKRRALGQPESNPPGQTLPMEVNMDPAQAHANRNRSPFAGPNTFSTPYTPYPSGNAQLPYSPTPVRYTNQHNPAWSTPQSTYGYGQNSHSFAPNALSSIESTPSGAPPTTSPLARYRSGTTPQPLETQFSGSRQPSVNQPNHQAPSDATLSQGVSTNPAVFAQERSHTLSQEFSFTYGAGRTAETQSRLSPDRPVIPLVTDMRDNERIPTPDVHSTEDNFGFPVESIDARAKEALAMYWAGPEAPPERITVLLLAQSSSLDDSALKQEWEKVSSTVFYGLRSSDDLSAEWDVMLKIYPALVALGMDGADPADNSAEAILGRVLERVNGLEPGYKVFASATASDIRAWFSNRSKNWFTILHHSLKDLQWPGPTTDNPQVVPRAHHALPGTSGAHASHPVLGSTPPPPASLSHGHSLHGSAAGAPNATQEPSIQSFATWTEQNRAHNMEPRVVIPSQPESQPQVTPMQSAPNVVHPTNQPQPAAPTHPGLSYHSYPAAPTHTGPPMYPPTSVHAANPNYSAAPMHTAPSLQGTNQSYPAQPHPVAQPGGIPYTYPSNAFNSTGQPNAMAYQPPVVQPYNPYSPYAPSPQPTIPVPPNRATAWEFSRDNHIYNQAQLAVLARKQEVLRGQSALNYIAGMRQLLEMQIRSLEWATQSTINLIYSTPYITDAFRDELHNRIREINRFNPLSVKYDQLMTDIVLKMRDSTLV